MGIRKCKKPIGDIIKASLEKQLAEANKKVDEKMRKRLKDKSKKDLQDRVTSILGL